MVERAAVAWHYRVMKSTRSDTVRLRVQISPSGQIFSFIFLVTYHIFMSDDLRLFRRTVRTLLNEVSGVERLERAYVPTSPPYPRERHVYSIDEGEMVKLYRLLDCIGVPYYRNRFPRVGDIHNSKTDIPRTLHDARSVEVLKKLDDQQFDFTREFVPSMEYIGLAEVDPDGNLIQFTVDNSIRELVAALKKL